MKRIYLSGPMTGIKDLNYPAFRAEALRLRSLGYAVENPADLPAGIPSCDSWEGYMRIAIGKLLLCDTVALLPGWSSSRGALIERALATDLRMKIVDSAKIRKINKVVVGLRSARV